MTIVKFKEMALVRLPRAVRYFVHGTLPLRQAVSYINFCIHTEMIYDEKIYRSLLKFSKDFNALTGKRITVCVKTPLCPLVRNEMAKYLLSEDELVFRLSDLKNFAEIGYHGHFYKEASSNLEEVSALNFEEDAVKRQMSAEIGWLRKAGIVPKVYIAGWWFLNQKIVSELEHFGIEIDVSIRKDKVDFFGGRYLEESEIPSYGRPFMLPPSRNILEIQSIFGPTMPSFIMKGYLSEFLDTEKDENLFLIFPLHDWDISKYYRTLWANVLTLDKYKDIIDWMDILKMREMYLKHGLVAK